MTINFKSFQPMPYAIVSCLSLLFLQNTACHANSPKSTDNTANHYLEANFSANAIFQGGDRLNQKMLFSPGFHIAHGSNITPVHALVMSWGKDFIKQDNATLTGAAFFLRRYMPKYSSPTLLVYSTMGSAFYQYKTARAAGTLENAGIILGAGVDWVYSKKIRFSLEADYRGFTVRQFENESTDYIRPFTVFAGLRYFYLTTHYSVTPLQTAIKKIAK